MRVSWLLRLIRVIWISKLLIGLLKSWVILWNKIICSLLSILEKHHLIIILWIYALKVRLINFIWCTISSVCFISSKFVISCSRSLWLSFSYLLIFWKVTSSFCFFRFSLSFRSIILILFFVLTWINIFHLSIYCFFRSNTSYVLLS